MAAAPFIKPDRPSSHNRLLTTQNYRDLKSFNVVSTLSSGLTGLPLAVPFLFGHMPRSRRQHGFIARVEQSKSAGYWCVIRSEHGEPVFAYGKSFLDWPSPVRPGWPVTFTELPPANGRMARAIEVAILPRQKPIASQITVEHEGGRLRVVLMAGDKRTKIGELKMQNQLSI